MTLFLIAEQHRGSLRDDFACINAGQEGFVWKLLPQEPSAHFTAAGKAWTRSHGAEEAQPGLGGRALREHPAPNPVPQQGHLPHPTSSHPHLPEFQLCPFGNLMVFAELKRGHFSREKKHPGNFADFVVCCNRVTENSIYLSTKYIPFWTSPAQLAQSMATGCCSPMLQEQ